MLKKHIIFLTVSIAAAPLLAIRTMPKQAGPPKASLFV